MSHAERLYVVVNAHGNPVTEPRPWGVAREWVQGFNDYSPLNPTPPSDMRDPNPNPPYSIAEVSR